LSSVSYTLYSGNPVLKFVWWSTVRRTFRLQTNDELMLRNRSP